jgi:hypothetical protein
MMKTNRISIVSKLIFRWLLMVTIILVLASIGGQAIKYITGHGSLHGLISLFYVDYEKNIPTLFSVFLLLSVALLLFIIILFKKKDSGSKIYLWIILFIGFIYLAIDEAWMIHEYLIYPVQKFLGTGDHGIFMVAWVVPGAAMVFLLLVLFWKFLISLPKSTRVSFIFAGAVYISGTIIVESISGYYLSKNGLSYLNQDFIYSMIVTLEESLEMVGIILFIRALLVYIASSFSEVHFRIE